MDARISLAFSLIFLCGCPSTETMDLGPSQANPLDSEEAAAMFEVNQVRAAAGVAPVTNCFSLNVSASAHADDMRDNDYLEETGLDGSTVQSRGCTAGYKAGCAANAEMAELVAMGIQTGEATVQQWVGNTTADAILVNPALIVLGIGRSISSSTTYWAADFGAVNEASCQGP
jgi:uncharacterized protein YkwD